MLATILSVPRNSAAQDNPRVGIVMGVPAEIGVLWSVTESFAVRPDLTWTKSSTEATTTTAVAFPVPGLSPISVTTSAESSQIGVGVSALVYVSKGEALRSYVSPRVGYSRVRATVDLGPVPLSPYATPSTTTLTSVAAAGSIGAQYSLAKRFAVFGEVGLSYAHTGDRSPSANIAFIDTTSNGWSVGIRSGVGVVLFFGS
jgi:hypothetical protein